MINLGVLGEWISTRPKWQQEALALLAKNGILTPEEKLRLYAQCKLTEGVVQVGSTQESNQIDDTRNEKVKIKIHQLSAIQGIGSIASNRPLSFNHDGLTVVFGRNGTGKTSYVKFLKTITGNRFAVPLIGNVFSSEVVPKKAKVQFSINDSVQSVEWNETDGKIGSLDCVAIYDSHCANIYVSSENEVTFEPQALKILTDLTAICLEFDAKLAGEIKSLASALPQLPKENQDHLLGKWYSSLSRTTTPEEIDQKCGWSAEDETQLKSINDRLAEANPAEKAKHLKRESEKIGELKKVIELSAAMYSDDACKAIILSRLESIKKRRAADDYAKTCFQGLPLEGVGTDTWKALWSAAKAYSEKAAYSGKTFPVVGELDRCVLCLRLHDSDSKKWFQSFEEFVVGKLESDAVKDENSYKKLVEPVKLPPDIEIAAKIKEASLEGQPEEIEIKSFFAELKTRHQFVLSTVDPSDLSPLSVNSLGDKLLNKVSDLQARISTLEADAATDNRAPLLAEKQTLIIKKWLHAHSEQCKAEVQRLKNIFSLEQARKTTSTAQISTKKSALSETLLTDAFVKRFQQELNGLRGGHIHVELVKTRTEKSKVYHQIRLKGVRQKINSNQILSEGEYRIVSLAAFLADLLGQERIGTFIFDDPISSLDQTYETATAERLIELSTERQVIVFTHRLSLASMLDEHGKNLVSLRQGGFPEELPIQWEKNTDKVINRLLNERLTQTRKLQQGDTVPYEACAKSLCSDIRILVERMIEFDLLCEVVIRYRASLTTKGRLDKLAVITKADAELLEAFMSKYSVFEHSNSPETPVNLPSADELEADLKRLQAWKSDLDKRKKAV